ncbi:hypothetical protein [Consotaella aegiceratis]|uniref:hypothetical protein n=1 Tax=Consotaella aegiceratis TaxID=3097961 RepID=UPI002F3F5D3B
MDKQQKSDGDRIGGIVLCDPVRVSRIGPDRIDLVQAGKSGAIRITAVGKGALRVDVLGSETIPGATVLADQVAVAHE